MLQEDFLKYIWRHKYFTSPELKTVCGKEISIVHTGTENQTDGPDFLMAKIEIDGVLWAGNVEIHINASDWYKHQHQNDKAYDNVVLHVVHNADGDVSVKGETLPTLELKDIIPLFLQTKYQTFLQNKSFIPCNTQHQDVVPIVKSAFLERVFIGRIEDKVSKIQQDYIENKLSLSQVFYKWVCLTLGQKNNVFPFEQLTQNLSIDILLKHKDKIEDLEALVFGVAGFLEETLDDYSLSLQKRYQHFKNLYKLQTLDKTLWNFKQVRPVGFPTLRLAFLAAFIKQWDAMFKAGLNVSFLQQSKSLGNLQASTYWDTHYTFGKGSARKEKKAGESLMRSLQINCFLPFYYFYSNRTGASSYEYVEKMFLEMPAEDNSIIREMKKLGFGIKNAKDAQTYLGLYKTFCKEKRCLKCGIGHALLKQ